MTKIQDSADAVMAKNFDLETIQRISTQFETIADTVARKQELSDSDMSNFLSSGEIDEFVKKLTYLLLTPLGVDILMIILPSLIDSVKRGERYTV